MSKLLASSTLQTKVNVFSKLLETEIQGVNAWSKELDKTMACSKTKTEILSTKEVDNALVVLCTSAYKLLETELGVDLTQPKDKKIDEVLKLYETFIQSMGLVSKAPHEKWPFFASCVRGQYAHMFSWSMIPLQTYQYMVCFLQGSKITQILDPLCGSGFMSCMFRRCGMPTLASDLQLVLPLAEHLDGKQFTRPLWIKDAREMPAEKLDFKQFGPETALLLSWVPFGDKVGEHCIANFKGDIIIWVGEMGGCCGTDKAIKMLQTHFTVLECTWLEIPVFQDVVYDGITIFRRKKIANA